LLHYFRIHLFLFITFKRKIIPNSKTMDLIRFALSNDGTYLYVTALAASTFQSPFLLAAGTALMEGVLAVLDRQDRSEYTGEGKARFGSFWSVLLVLAAILSVGSIGFSVVTTVTPFAILASAPAGLVFLAIYQACTPLFEQPLSLARGSLGNMSLPILVGLALMASGLAVFCTPWFAPENAAAIPWTALGWVGASTGISMLLSVLSPLATEYVRVVLCDASVFIAAAGPDCTCRADCPLCSMAQWLSLQPLLRCGHTSPPRCWRDWRPRARHCCCWWCGWSYPSCGLDQVRHGLPEGCLGWMECRLRIMPLCCWCWVDRRF
jgi:hypothetical protein